MNKQDGAGAIFFIGGLILAGIVFLLIASLLG